MSRKGRTGYLGMFAFVAIVLNAIAWIIQIILTALRVDNSIGGILTGVASVLLLIVVLVSAYDFASRQTKFWRIVFWILAIISLLAIFLGVGLPNFIKAN